VPFVSLTIPITSPKQPREFWASEKGSQIWFQAEHAGDEIIVRVRDTGIGIPSDKLPNIFDIFMQVDRSLNWCFSISACRG
jgi:light-regulated signal transduction histidine kinase (bacteriophytochrome)